MPKDNFDDLIWDKGIELFGPKFWGTPFTEKHVEKIYNSLGYKYHSTNKAHGGPVKKKRGSYMGGGKVHRKEYAKGGGVRKAARYS